MTNPHSNTQEPANNITIKIYRNGKFTGELFGKLAVVSILTARDMRLKTLKGEILIEGEGSKNEIKILGNLIQAHMTQVISSTPSPLPKGVARDLKCRWCKKKIAEKDFQKQDNFNKFKKYGLCLKCSTKIYSEDK